MVQRQDHKKLPKKEGKERKNERATIASTKSYYLLLTLVVDCSLCADKSTQKTVVAQNGKKPGRIFAIGRVSEETTHRPGT